MALSSKKFNITNICTAFKILLHISDMVLNFLGEQGSLQSYTEFVRFSELRLFPML